MKTMLTGLGLTLPLLLSACSSTPNIDPSSTNSVPADRSGLGRIGSNSGLEQAPSAPGGADARDSVFFDYESSVIKPEGDALISSWSESLLAHPGSTILVEGNTDERGTREYNIGLGERRANAAAMVLEAHGVSPSQISIVSYGEERPVGTGHDEASWVQNRRDDLIK